MKQQTRGYLEKKEKVIIDYFASCSLRVRSLGYPLPLLTPKAEQHPHHGAVFYSLECLFDATQNIHKVIARKSDHRRL
jgi:hypothetical protein